MPYRRIASLFVALALISVVWSASGPAPAGAHSMSAHSRRLPPPVAGSYAALGASETFGVGAEPHTRGYAYLVARTLHAHPFADLGISGATLAAAYRSELTGARAIRPQLCTLFFGFNDARLGVARNAFLSQLKKLVVALRRSQCQVLVIGEPDLSLLPAVSQSGVSGIHQMVVSWNSGMRKVAKRHGAYFLNLDEYSKELAAHPEYVSSDGLHPSNAGHRRLAAVVVQAVRKYWLFTRP